MSKRTMGVLAVVVLLASAVLGGRATSANADNDGRTVLKFHSMVGVPRAYTSALSPIRGVNGGGLPWVVAAAQGELKESGALKVKVRGVVFDPADPGVIARGLANQNTVPNFRAIVSCQSIDANGVASVVNVATDLFPATTGFVADGGGNAEIETKVNLPRPCIAPIIFVTSPAGSWFTATGF